MALSYDASVKAALDAALPGQKLTEADYHWWTNNGGAAAVQNQWGAPAPAPAPAPSVGAGNNGFAVSGQGTTSNAQSVYTPTTPMRDVPGGYQVDTALSTDPDWATRGLADPNKTNPLGGNLNMGTLMMHGFKTPEEYLAWQAENVKKAAADTSGFAVGGQGAASTKPASGGNGAAATPPGLVGGAFQQWDVTAPQTVQSQAAAIANADGTLMQQARGRAMQAMNERGLVNSTLAIQAGQDAVLDRAIQIAQQDAATNAEAAKFNAGQSNAWTLAQQELAEKASQFTRELAAKYDLAKFDLESRQSLAATEREYQQQLATDKAFQDQYQMYVDALFKIDSDPELSAEAKTARKQEQLNLLKNYASIRGLNLSQYLTFSTPTATAPAPAPAAATGLVSQADNFGD